METNQASLAGILIIPDASAIPFPNLLTSIITDKQVLVTRVYKGYLLVD